MIVKKIVVGPLQTNCYISIDDNKDAIVIDPGSDAEAILDFIKKKELCIKKIINTHGHADHIGGNRVLKEFTRADICIHSGDAECLINANLNGSILTGESIVSLEADVLLKEGSEIVLGTNVFKVMHTPGHTKGSICLITQNSIFTGDTLFEGGVGRTDLYGGSLEDLKNSLKKISHISQDMKIYPGHGDITTLSKEKKINPFL